MEAKLQDADIQITLSPTQQEVYDQLLASGWPDNLETLQMVIDNVEPDKPRFAVTDMQSANWVLKKMAQAKAEIAEVSAMIDAEIGAIHARGEKILKPLKAKYDFFEQSYGSELEEWVAGQLEGKKEKSVKLLHGKAGFRKSPDALEIEDEDTAKSWLAANHCDCITLSIAKTPLKTLVMKDGLQVPGVTVKPGESKFYLEAKIPGGKSDA